MSTAAKECLRVQLLTPGLAVGQCSVPNTLRAPGMACECITWAVTENRSWTVTAVTPRTGKH